MLPRHCPFKCVSSGLACFAFQEEWKKTNRTHDWTAVTLLHMYKPIFMVCTVRIFLCPKVHLIE
jgi:hypothetical protein